MGRTVYLPTFQVDFFVADMNILSVSFKFNRKVPPISIVTIILPVKHGVVFVYQDHTNQLKTFDMFFSLT